MSAIFMLSSVQPPTDFGLLFESRFDCAALFELRVWALFEVELLRHPSCLGVALRGSFLAQLLCPSEKSCVLIFRCKIVALFPKFNSYANTTNLHTICRRRETLIILRAHQSVDWKQWEESAE